MRKHFPSTGRGARPADAFASWRPAVVIQAMNIRAPRLKRKIIQKRSTLLNKIFQGARTKFNSRAVQREQWRSDSGAAVRRTRGGACGRASATRRVAQSGATPGGGLQLVGARCALCWRRTVMDFRVGRLFEPQGVGLGVLFARKGRVSPDWGSGLSDRRGTESTDKDGPVRTVKNMYL